MTRLIISTIRRQGPPTEPSGFIYTADLEQGQVLKRSYIVEPAFREVDDNPRGGLRGGKGISVREDQIALANFSMIFRYDPQWKLSGVISHPSCSAIHDIVYQGDTIWAAAARTDMLMQFDLDGKLLRYEYLRDNLAALGELGWNPPLLLNSAQVTQGKIDFRDPRTHTKEVFDQAHVNSLHLMPDGSILVSMGFVFGIQYQKLIRMKIWLVKRGVWPKLMLLNQKARSLIGKQQKNVDKSLVVRPAKAQSALVQVAPGGGRKLKLAIPNMTAPSHSLLGLPDGTVAYLNTSEGMVIHFDPHSQAVLSTTKVTDGFLRGATRLPDGRILLGSLGEIIVFDLAERRVLSSFRLTDDPKESVYDIKVLPDHYAMPPDSFEQHFVQATGYKNAADMIQRMK